MKLTLDTPKAIGPTTTTVKVDNVSVDLDTGNLVVTFHSTTTQGNLPPLPLVGTAALSGAQRTAVRNLIKTAIESVLGTTTTDAGA